MLLVLLIGILTSGLALAQWRNNSSVKLNANVGQSEALVSLAAFQHVPIAFNKRLKVGLGLRSNHYFSGQQNYETAPARITTNQTGPQVLFIPSYPQNIDTFRVSNSQVNSLNLAIDFQFDITPKWRVGTNIDLIGISYGPKTNGDFISSFSPDPNTPRNFSSTPTPTNILLISDNDVGSLNSEFYAQYQLNHWFDINAGLSFHFAELTTAFKPIFDNDRFRRKSVMGFVGVTWYPFR